MARWSLLRQPGSASGSTGGGGGNSQNNVPDVQSISCSGFMDGVSGGITLTVGVTPPNPLGAFIGVHLFLEIPDQSANTAQVVGTTAVGSAAVTGNWNVLDLGDYPFVGSQQPWTVTSPGSPGINPALDVPCRLYAVAYSSGDENIFVQANQLSASPNVAFTLVSLASGSPTAGTSVTAVCGPIAAAALSPDNSTGKLKTPVAVVVSSVPANVPPTWCYRLVLTMNTADSTVASNQFIVSDLLTTVGPIIAPADGITTPHSFVLDTPTGTTNATVWAQSGLNDNGTFRPNPIVPGITPSFPLTYGATGGTIDLSKALSSSLNGTLVASAGIFGVGVIGSANIGVAQITTAHIQNANITDQLIASGIDAGKINVGTLIVGAGGGSGAPFIRVNNSSGTQVGWIGSTVIGGTTFNGGWFQELRVGGTAPNNAVIQSDSGGNVTMTNGSLTWPAQTVGPNVLGMSLSAGQFVCAKYVSGVPFQNVQIDGTGIFIAQGAFVASMTAQSLSVPLGISCQSLSASNTVSANNIILKAGNLSSNNTGVPMNYGSGMMFTGTLAGVSGSLASYSNAINVYDANGSFIGRIPLI